MDENDDEYWKEWSTDPGADLSLLAPAKWPLFYPCEIHPEFRAWFRDRYKEACWMLREDLKAGQFKHLDYLRRAVFEGKQ